MPKLIVSIAEILCVIASIIVAAMWTRNPVGSFEPTLALLASASVGLDMFRRYLRSAKLHVFLSVGATYTPEQEDFVREFERVMIENELLQLVVGRHSTPSRQPVLEIRDRMRSADAVVVLAFTRYEITSGIEKPGASLPGHVPTTIANVKCPTIWNQIEAGIAFGLGKPLLMIIEDGVKQEAMLKDRFEFRALTAPLDPHYFTTEPFKSLFHDFVTIARRRSWFRL